MNNIYFKLTTVPVTEDSTSKEFELFYDKYKDYKEFKTHEDALKSFQNEAAKNPTFARIYSITSAFVIGDEMRIKVFKGKEESILKEFINIFTATDFGKAATPVLWNAEFVLPFLTTRMVKNNIKISSLPISLRHFGLKPWGLKCIDLFSYIKGAGWYGMSLEETAFNFNLSTDFLDPATIPTLIKNGEKETVDQSSIDEVKTIVNLHRLVNDLEPIENIIWDVVELEDDVQVQELPLLEKLYNTKNFEGLKEELKKQLNERGFNKKTPKKEKETVKKLVLAHYLERITFDDTDKKSKEEINKNRTEEIENFFKTL